MRRISPLSFPKTIWKTTAVLRRPQTNEVARRLGPEREPPRGKAPPARDGREAETPADIPPRGWWQVAKRTATKFNENQLMKEAAGVTFYALLSLFPALTALVSLYGLFFDPRSITDHLDMLSGLVPGGGMDIITDQVRRLTATPSSGLTLGAVGGVLAAIWSANQGAKAMFSALNDVYGEREERKFVRLTMTSLAFTLGAIVALLLAMALIVVVPLAVQMVSANVALAAAVRIVRIPIVIVAIMLALAVLYRYGPSRHEARWRWVTWGGAFGATAWVSLSAAFSWYVEHFGNYNKTYGSLGAVIGFMTWIWLSSTVLLLGAQINAEMEAQTAQDTTTGRARPLGARGAAAADVVR